MSETVDILLIKYTDIKISSSNIYFSFLDFEISLVEDESLLLVSQDPSVSWMSLTVTPALPAFSISSNSTSKNRKRSHRDADEARQINFKSSTSIHIFLVGMSDNISWPILSARY